MSSEETVKVEVLINVNHDGETVLAGEVIEVSDATAAYMAENGCGRIIDGGNAPQEDPDLDDEEPAPADDAKPKKAKK